MEMKDLLTEDEKKALQLTCELANLLGKICRTPSRPKGHHHSLEDWIGNQSNDWAECAVEIHAIQHRLMAQAAARAFPDQYRLMGQLLDRSKQESETLHFFEGDGTVLP